MSHFAFENMTFRHAGGVPVFTELDADLPSNAAVWVTADRERGRSTLLRILAGLEHPQSGRYLLDGNDVSQMTFEDFLPYRLKMGYGFDLGGLINNRSLADNLLLPLVYHNLCSKSEARDRVMTLLERFGLDEAAELRPYVLSGSERKLACILRAFVHDPETVFLDEPLSGIKGQRTGELVKFIRESFKLRGLRQVFFTGDAPFLAIAMPCEELMISRREFKVRPAVGLR